MPAKSKSQQRIMGWAHACQTGRGSNCDRIDKLVSSIKLKDAEEFARTKHKGLPERKRKKKPKTFQEYIEEITMKSYQQWHEAIDDVVMAPPAAKMPIKSSPDRMDFGKLGPNVRLSAKVRTAGKQWDKRVGGAVSDQSVNQRLRELMDELSILVGSDPNSVAELRKDQQLLRKVGPLVRKLQGLIADQAQQAAHM